MAIPSPLFHGTNTADERLFIGENPDVHNLHCFYTTSPLRALGYAYDNTRKAILGMYNSEPELDAQMVVLVLPVWRKTHFEVTGGDKESYRLVSQPPSSIEVIDPESPEHKNVRVYMPQDLDDFIADYSPKQLWLAQLHLTSHRERLNELRERFL